MELRRLVGQTIKFYRSRAGISQEELAARIDAEQGYISRLEAGALNPTIDTIASIAKALNVAPDELFRLPDIMKQKSQRKGTTAKR